MQRIPRLLLLAVLLLGLALASGWLGAFAIHNRQWVPLNLPDLPGDGDEWVRVIPLEVQLAWLVIGSAVGGFALALLLLVIPAALGRLFTRHRDQRLIRALEEELADLRRLQVLEPTPLDDIDDAPLRPRVDGIGGVVSEDAIDLDGPAGATEPPR